MLASVIPLMLVVTALVSGSAPAHADQSTLATVTAGGVTADVNFAPNRTAVSTCNACVGVPVVMTTSGPGTLTFTAMAAGSASPVSGTLTATAAGSVSTVVQVCPGTNGSGSFTVTGVFTAGGATAPIPADVAFTVTEATPSFASLTAQQKGSRTTVAGQVLIQSSVGMVGATGPVQLSVSASQGAGRASRWVSLGTVPVTPGTGTFTARFPAAKAPRGSVVRAVLVVAAGCTAARQPAKVS